jgi:hypothetical protein
VLTFAAPDTRAMSDPKHTLTHDVPMTLATRLVFGAAGLFAILIPAWDLRHGLWPLTATTPFFAIIALGGAFVGVVFLIGALTGVNARWTISPGLILIESRRPFKKPKILILTSADDVRFSLEKADWSDGATTWKVRLDTLGGEHYTSDHFATSEAADAFRASMETLFGQ